jgi:predicted CopG family antitoxin
MNENELLEQAVVNQLEVDLNNKEYDSLSELLKNLIKLKSAKTLLIEYLGHMELEDWVENKTKIKY